MSYDGHTTREMRSIPNAEINSETLDRTGIRWRESGEQPNQCALSRPVGADQGGESSRPDGIQLTHGYWPGKLPE